MRFVLFFLLGLFHVQGAWAQESSSDKPDFMQWTENVEIDAELWAEAIASVKQRLTKKRSGNAKAINNDIYDLSFLDYIQPEYLNFQSYAIWIDLSIGAKFKDENRGYVKVLERLQSESSIAETEYFLEDCYHALSETEDKCNIDVAPYIGGIFSIETFFGQYKSVPKFPTLATLVSWVALSHEGFRAHVLEQYYSQIDLKHAFADNQTDKIFIPGSKFANKQTWINRASRRAQKSMTQLRDFFNLAHSMQWDEYILYNTEGSWVGAFTDGQFMPSTMRFVLEPGESIDPNNLEDTIYLIGRYLSKYWRDGSPANIDRAIKYYNSPQWYRQHVISIARQVNPRWQKILQENDQE